MLNLYDLHMLIAQVQEIVVKSATPWWTIGSAVAVALIGWFVIHRTSKTRDLENWRRTTVAEAVAETITHSMAYLTAAKLLVDGRATGLALEMHLTDLIKAQNAMESKKHLIEISGTDKVDEIAHELRMLHANNTKMLEFIELYEDEQSTGEEIDVVAKTLNPTWTELKAVHNRLILATQYSVGIRKNKQTFSERLNNIKVLLMISGS